MTEATLAAATMPCPEPGTRVPRSPATVDLTITNRCNLRCRYCSHFSSAADVGRDLPTEAWLALFRELGEIAVMDVVLSGGEPFIREYIRTLIDGIVAHRMRFSALSNGTLIDDALAAFLKGTGRCGHVQVSIDGSGPDAHDFARGDGSFAKAMAGLKALRRHGVPAAVRVTIHRRNLDDLEAIAAMLLDEVGLEGFSTNAASHLGLCRQNQEMMALTPEEHSRAMDMLLRLNEKYGGRISAQAGPLASARQWLEMVEARNQGLPGLPGCGHLRSCGGVFRTLAVRADGMMIPCTQLPHIELGRIGEVPVTAAWLDHPEMRRLRQRRQVPLGDFPFCRGCAYIPFCKGGCPALAFTLAGDDGVPSPEACLRRFLADGGQLPKPERLAPGQP